MIIEYLERTYDYSKLQILNGKHYYHKNEIIIGSFNWTQLISKCGMMTFPPFCLVITYCQNKHTCHIWSAQQILESSLGKICLNIERPHMN